jgi:VanZ family protein
MKKIIVIFCILWIGIVFFNSSNIGSVSNEKSYTIVNFIKSDNIYKKHIRKYVDIESSTLNLIVRKSAHFIEYLILGIIISFALFKYNFKGKGALGYILFICLLCAVMDEFYQKFIQGRTSNVEDILIDFAGGLFGIFIFYICCRKLPICSKVNSGGEIYNVCNKKDPIN